MKYNTFKYGQTKYGTESHIWIYDRSSIDIANRTKKAFFNYSDMNRLEANAKYLSNLLAEIGYNLPYAITKTWTLQDIPKFLQLEKIRKYVENVIKIIPLNNNTIVFPSTLNKMNYVVLNNLEKAMYVLTANIKSIKTAYKYSGEIYSGEE